MYRPYGKVHSCTGTEALYRPYGKVHPCTGTEALYRPYGKAHRCSGTETLYRPYGKVHRCTGTGALYRPYGKVTVVQALRLCTGRTAHKENTGIALPFHDHSTRRGGGQRHAPAALYPGIDSVPILQEAGWDPGPFWTGAENLASTRIRSPDRPARCQ
jgi:hypothetical protein